MKTLLTLPIVLLLIGWSGAGRTLAQDQSSATPTPEITQKDDRLPFMASQEEAERSSSEPGSGMLLVKSLGAMVLVLSLIFFGAWGARKLGFGTVKSDTGEDPIDLKVLTSVAVGSGRTIAAVNFGGRILLVGSTANTFTLLAEEEKEVTQAQFQPKSVAELLREEISFGQEFDRALAGEDA